MLGFISARGCKSTLGNWAVETLIKGAKLDPKTRLFLTEIVSFLGIKQILLVYNVGLSEDLHVYPRGTQTFSSVIVRHQRCQIPVRETIVK